MGNESRKKFCELCRQNVQDDVKYGKFMTKGKISVHYYCLLLSSNLIQNGEENEGFLGFLPHDIVREAKRVKLQICCYCRKDYANVACCAAKCRRTFHLSCGIENGVMSHFTDTYQSFCPRDVKWNKSERPKSDEICLICYEKLGKFNKYFMILSPCCKTGWFHRWCLASFALSAGYFFKCPKCNDTTTFREQVVRKGIFIPDQDAAWELESNAFAELLERPNECIADKCYCSNGRNFNEAPNNFIMCQTCGSKAIHKQCMLNKSSIFTCNDCSEILKKRNINLDHILSEDEKMSDYEDENERNDGNNEDKDLNIIDNIEDDITNRNDTLYSNKIKDHNLNAENNVYESDTSSSKINYRLIKIKRKRLRVDSEDENEEEYLATNDDEELIMSGESSTSKKNENNHDKNSDNNELKETRSITNITNTNRSPSCSSLESINNVIRGREKKRKCIRRFSESSSISSLSSSDIPLSRQIFRNNLRSRESSNSKDLAGKCEITDNIDVSSAVDNATEKSLAKINDNKQKQKRKNSKNENENKRRSSLGYISDNSLPHSSIENIKHESNYGNEKENQKIRKRRKRSTINSYNYDNEDDSMELNNTSSNDSGRTLRKRKKKNTPYQLRERCESISYEDADEDYVSYDRLRRDWSTIFHSSKRNNTKCNNNNKKTPSPSQNKRKSPKRKASTKNVISPGQTSIDSFFRRSSTNV